MMTTSQARENFLAAMETLRSAKVRSFLTVMGIVIGVSSVISMAAIIGGLNKFVADKVQSLGSRTYFVTRFPPGTDPAHWPELYRKVADMWRTQPHYTLQELGTIRSPTLVMAGEFDVIRRTGPSAFAFENILITTMRRSSARPRPR